MKKFLCIALGFLAAACGKAAPKDAALINKPEGRVLVVYYSESPNRNTQAVAQWISDALGADIEGIEPVTPYTGGYRAIVRQSRIEIRNNIHPEIKPMAKNVADYDVIFIGSPIWHSTYAPPVATFLAANDFTGKTVVPFCTHGGGGAGRFYKNIKENAKGAAVVKKGFTARGSNVIERRFGRGTKNKLSENDVIIWLNEIFKK